MCNYSEEGDTTCLGIFNQQVKKFKGSLKVPQIGWNKINRLQSPLFTGINEKEYMYFVHSYYADLGENTIAQTDYDLTYSSALYKNNI